MDNFLPLVIEGVDERMPSTNSINESIITLRALGHQRLLLGHQIGFVYNPPVPGRQIINVLWLAPSVHIPDAVSARPQRHFLFYSNSGENSIQICRSAFLKVAEIDAKLAANIFNRRLTVQIRRNVNLPTDSGDFLLLKRQNPIRDASNHTQRGKLRK